MKWYVLHLAKLSFMFLNDRNSQISKHLTYSNISEYMPHMESCKPQINLWHLNDHKIYKFRRSDDHDRNCECFFSQFGYKFRKLVEYCSFSWILCHRNSSFYDISLNCCFYGFARFPVTRTSVILMLHCSSPV